MQEKHLESAALEEENLLSKYYVLFPNDGDDVCGSMISLLSS